MGYIIDQIPWWLYAWVIAIAVGAVLYFFAPIVVPLWQRSPAWFKWAVALVTGIGLAFIAGRNRGNKNAQVEQERKNAQAEQRRVDVHKEVSTLKRPVVDKRLDKWMRD
jgi:Na+/H+ antiporter NhaC